MVYFRHKNVCVLPAKITVDKLLDDYTRKMKKISFVKLDAPLEFSVFFLSKDLTIFVDSYLFYINTK